MWSETVTHTPVRVRVNNELILDAGTWYAARRDGVEGVRLLPPKRSQFEQLIDYLKLKKDPPPARLVNIDVEALAATALCLRWGTYFAALADEEKPIWPLAVIPTVSSVSREELERITLEACSALEQWIDLYRDRVFARRLAERAVHYLPMPRYFARSFAMLRVADYGHARQIIEKAPPCTRQRALAEAAEAPTRALANALVLWTFRNGPIAEAVHGRVSGYPLDRRRILPKDERTILGVTAARMRTAVEAWTRLQDSADERTWSQKVAPFQMVDGLATDGWPLTRRSCELFLPA